MQRYSCIVNMFFCAIENKDYAWFLHSSCGLLKGLGIDYGDAYASVTSIVSSQGGDESTEVMEYITGNMTEEMYAVEKEITCRALKKRIERKGGATDCSICPLFSRYTNAYEDVAYQILSGYMTRQSARDIQSRLLKAKDYETVFRARDIVYAEKVTRTIPTYEIIFRSCKEIPIIYKVADNEDYLNDEGKNLLKEKFHEEIRNLYPECSEEEIQTILFRADMLFTFIMNGGGLLPDGERYEQFIEKNIEDVRGERRRTSGKTEQKKLDAPVDGSAEEEKPPVVPEESPVPESKPQEEIAETPKTGKKPKSSDSPSEKAPKAENQPKASKSEEGGGRETEQNSEPSTYSSFWNELLSDIDKQEKAAEKKETEKQAAEKKKEDFSDYLKRYVNAEDKLFLPSDSTEIDRGAFDRFYYLLLEEGIQMLPFEMVSTDHEMCMVFFVHDRYYHIRDYDIPLLRDSKIRSLVQFVTGRPFAATAIYEKHITQSVYLAYVNSLDRLERTMLRKDKYSMTGLICKILGIRKEEEQTDLAFLLSHYTEAYQALASYDRKGYKELLRIAEYRSASYLGKGLVTKPGFRLFEYDGQYRMNYRVSDLQIRQDHMHIIVRVPGIRADGAEHVLSMAAETDAGKAPAWLLDANMERGEFHYLCTKRESADARQYLHLLYKFWVEHLTDCRCIQLTDVGDRN